MELKIIISEPWDFESSDGKNDDVLIISQRNESGDINIFQKNKAGNLQLKMVGTYAHKYKRSFTN